MARMRRCSTQQWRRQSRPQCRKGLPSRRVPLAPARAWRGPARRRPSARTHARAPRRRRGAMPPLDLRA
eukprot:14515263-Alexandrium_andersonii.AAC.1